MKKTNITALILLFMLVISFILPVEQASAAATLDVQAKVGIAGKAKSQSVVPLQVTVKNNGADFSGDMVINASSSYEAASAQVLPIDIAAGEEKTFDIYLEGIDNYNSSNADVFAFFEGGIEKGKKVAYNGTKQLQGNLLDPSSVFIYTLTDKSDRLSAFLSLSQLAPQNNVEVFNLNQIKDYTLPENTEGFAMANVIVIDEIAIADLSQKQQESLLKWVQNGGTLLLGAADQVNATAGIFKDYLPLALSQQMTSVSADSLSKLSGGGIFTKSISVYSATENQESIPVLTDNNTILTSKKKVGSGEIIQTAFSLGDQPLASMDGYVALISKILNIQSIQQQGVMHGQSAIDKIYDIQQVNELFPSFEVSVSYMLIVIILYIVIIGPVLYFILKKMDKREHAWWVIPVISIVLSIGLFIFGAKDRIIQPQVQQAAFYKINDDRSVNGYYVESILTNRSGDFVVNANKDTTALALRKYDRFSGSSRELYEFSYIKEHSNGSTLTLRDLSYWSVQSFAGKTEAPNIGKMDIDITLKNEKLSGTIKNNFPFALKDVTLFSGIKEIRLGDIEPNGTLKVDTELKTTVLQRPSIFNNYNFSFPTKKQEINPALIERINNQALQLVENDKKPVITAWADQAIAGVELETSANMSPISYFVQPFDGKVELSGPFTMKRNNFTYSVNPLSSNANYNEIDEQLNNWYLSDGLYEVSIAMPDNFMNLVQTLNELTISNKDVNRMQLSIWNNETKKYEPFVDAKQVFTDNITKYFNNNDELLIEIKFGPDQTGEQTKLPDIELKGVAK
ncbi:hypothetical protein FJQ98_04995 [Lysinibacillus agricola]|uniref:Uncharacterized protein n=1 Tax=Lysinibacillus agricola TaxID=2590012 RepID=A0ABX7ATY1_9BACI|nr:MULTISPECIES: hypothetical protein [Lysinibacillus]KOS62476.1 hypothetical protein AN161_12850 [Lysinibacillus sp. FJAT-14222]QQP13422.1 hypothetical protein FJQ98_04995 [Lysinibacillus agricola]